MNKVFLSGRPTTEIELKGTAAGVPVATFDLAVDRKSKDKKPDYITVVAWRKTAEFAAKYVGKGKKIIVEGEIRTRFYEDKNGKKHKVIEVLADTIEFADSKPQEQQSSTPPEDEPSEEDFEEIEALEDEDIPY